MDKPTASAPPRHFSWFGYRRRFPRFEIDGTFRIQDVTSGTSVELLDIGFGGFRSTSSVLLNPGTCHALEVELHPPDRATLHACVVHRYAAEDQPNTYLVGWTWAEMPVNVEGIPIAVISVIDYLTSSRSPVGVVVKR